MKKKVKAFRWIVILLGTMFLLLGANAQQDIFLLQGVDLSVDSMGISGDSLCRQRGHVEGAMSISTLHWCPPYIDDTECYTVKVTPGCNSRESRCERCGKLITYIPATDIRDTIWVNPECQEQEIFEVLSNEMYSTLVIECNRTGPVPTYADIQYYYDTYKGFVPMWIDELGHVHYDPDGEYWTLLEEIVDLLNDRR